MVTLWVVGILDVGESFIAFRLLVLSGLAETVVDVVVGSSVVTRVASLPVAVGLFWAEVDATMLAGAVVTVDVSMGVRAEFCLSGFELNVCSLVVVDATNWTMLLTGEVCSSVVPVTFSMDKDNTESIRVLAGSLSLSVAPGLPQDPEALLSSLPFSSVPFCISFPKL